MDEEVIKKSKEENLTKDEAEELQNFVDETGLDADEAYDLSQEL